MIATAPLPVHEELQKLQDLYDAGLFLQAHEAAKAWGPLSTWSGTAPRIMAARLAGHLGAPRLGDWLMRKARRDDPESPDARYYFTYSVWRRRGVYAAWRFMQDHGEMPADASSDLRSSWCAMLGETAAALRDFEVAEKWLLRAREIAPHSAWIRVCQSNVAELEDRYDEALALAREALDIQPWHRPALQQLAHLLILKNKDGEALDLLTEACQRVQHGGLAAQRFALQIELRQFREAGQSLDRFQECSPLLEKGGAKWLVAQRYEVAYYLGDVAAAIRFAEESGAEYLKVIAERLKDPARAQAKQALLPVGFVRQHHVTCGPATLAAIGKFWDTPTDHLQIAAAICYDGTTHYSERHWAGQNGWLAREFSVTEASAVALIDRGAPFTFTTVEPGNAHLQAIIGYDLRRGTLAVRDPFFRNSGECLTDKFLERYRAYGPRGMVLVPAERGDLLDGIELPDAPLWDELHALESALAAHDRKRAQASAECMAAAAPGHRLAYEAQRRLAIYDGNATLHLAALEKLFQMFPDNPALQLERLSVLRPHQLREERLAALRETCAKKDANPIFWRHYAQELSKDARRHDDAVWLLRRAIRRWPTDGANYYILANIYWDQRRYQEAIELYRVAACLDDKNEQLMLAYFSAANWLRQTSVVLQFLRDRFTRYGGQSNQPAQTLCSAYLQLQRPREALETIEAALRLRPDDGELMLSAADLYTSCSLEHAPRAAALIAQAKDRASRSVWLRSAARLAKNEGRAVEALGYWRDVLESQPLAHDAYESVARLLAELEGESATLQFLSAALEKYPHYYPLHELHIEWLRTHPVEAREPAVRRLAEGNPDDAWVRRELAFLLESERRFPEAWEELKTALRLDPHHPSAHYVWAKLAASEGDLPAAKAALRRALELSVDYDFAVMLWLDLCETPAERREVLLFFQRQLVEQVTFGDGLLALQAHARSGLSDEELRDLLREALQARPDLWHASSALAQHLLTMNQLDEAREIARAGTEQFPLLPRLWLDLAVVCRAREDRQEELEALQNALRINPNWGEAVRTLCDFHDRKGEFEKSRELLEQAIQRDPRNVASRIQLAETLWRLSDREAAMAQVQQAVRIDPGYQQAWDCLNTWSDTLGCPEKALESVRSLTERRPGEARSWLMLARLLDAPEQREERLAALEKAISLSPRCVDAFDKKARTLAALGRWEEALATCQPPIFNNHPPAELQACAAWIEAERGDIPQAIRRMTELVQVEPNYYGGWSQLADWRQQVNDLPGYLEAAENLARIAPQYEVSMGYLGEARLLNGNREGARDCYRRAFELCPTYQFAGNALFDLQLADGQLADAAETLAVLQKQVGGAFVALRAVQLATKQGERETLLSAFREVCRTNCESPAPVTMSVAAMVETGWRDAALDILDSALSDPQAHWKVAQAWGELRGARGDTDVGPRLRSLLEQEPADPWPTHAFFKGLKEAQLGPKILQFARENETWLRTNTITWGSVAYAFTGVRAYRECAQWSRDWRDRPDAPAWVLVNCVEGFWDQRQDAEAIACSQSSLEKNEKGDFGQHLHHLWLAAARVLDGNIAAASVHLPHINAEPLDADNLFLETVVRCAVEIAESPPHRMAAAFPAIREKLDAARKNYAAYQHEPARRRVYRAALWRIAADGNTLSDWWWAVNRWWNS